MTVRQIDTENDWTFGSGISNYKRNSDEIRQNIKTRLQMWKDNCFFALKNGVDYNRYLTGTSNKLLEEDVRRVIIQTIGVAELKDIQVIVKDRKLELSYTVTDIYSQTWEETINALGVNDA